MKPFITRHRTYLALAAILVVSAGLHLWHIEKPAYPLFDERHFATYAADYVNGVVPLDIHPPFGKLYFAGALTFVGGPQGTGKFLVLRSTPDGKIIGDAPIGDFGAYPYVPLRIASSLVGVALAAVIFLFMRSMGAGDDAALLAAFLTAFEAALLTQTRFILLDGVYLALGLLAVSVLVRDTYRAALVGGLAWGFALGTKLIAIVFLLPAFARLRGNGLSFIGRLFLFGGTGFAILTSAFAFHGFYFTAPERFAPIRALNLMEDLIDKAPNGALSAQALASFAELEFSAGGYIGKMPEEGRVAAAYGQPGGSPWFLWPFMREPMVFGSIIAERTTVLIGNPVIWLGVLVAVVVGVVTVIRQFLRGGRQAVDDALLIPLIGYASALAPFALFVSRATFLYHYLPALLFGICLLAYLVARELRTLAATRGAAAAEAAAAVLIGAVILGFALVSPFVYAFA